MGRYRYSEDDETDSYMTDDHSNAKLSEDDSVSVIPSTSARKSQQQRNSLLCDECGKKIPIASKKRKRPTQMSEMKGRRLKQYAKRSKRTKSRSPIRRVRRRTLDKLKKRGPQKKPRKATVKSSPYQLRPRPHRMVYADDEVVTLTRSEEEVKMAGIEGQEEQDGDVPEDDRPVLPVENYSTGEIEINEENEGAKRQRRDDSQNSQGSGQDEVEANK